METEQLIPADEWCTHYNVSVSFVHSLEEYGLIQITTVEEKIFIPLQELSNLERYARLHYDLDINLEGIDAIANLLQRLKEMHHEIALLKNKLHTHALVAEGAREEEQ